MCGQRLDCADQHCPGRTNALFEQRCGGAIIQDGHDIADEFLYAEKTAGTAFEMLVGLILCVVLVPLLLWLSLTV
jgi:hypothetical protein